MATHDAKCVTRSRTIYTLLIATRISSSLRFQSFWIFAPYTSREHLISYTIVVRSFSIVISLVDCVSFSHLLSSLSAYSPLPEICLPTSRGRPFRPTGCSRVAVGRAHLVSSNERRPNGRTNGCHSRKRHERENARYESRIHNTHTRARVAVVVVVDGHGRIVVRIRACTGHETRTTAHSIHVPPWGIRDRPRHRRVESTSAGESSAARRRNCESEQRARARPRVFEKFTERLGRDARSYITVRVICQVVITRYHYRLQSRASFVEIIADFRVRSDARTTRRLCVELCVKTATKFGFVSNVKLMLLLARLRTRYTSLWCRLLNILNLNRVKVISFFSYSRFAEDEIKLILRQKNLNHDRQYTSGV